jgi:O-antigen/teichoic acid export membrane protein
MEAMLAKFKGLPESLRHSLFFGCSMMGIRLVGFLLIPFFTHYLTPSQYARLDLLQSLADVIGMIVIVGLADTLFKFVGEEKSEKKKHLTAGRIYRLSVGLSLICSVVFQILAPHIQALFPLKIDIWSVRFILVSVSISPMILVALSWLRMEGYVVKFVKETVLRAILQGALSVVVLIVGLGVSGVMAASMVASVMTAMSLHRHMLKKKVWVKSFEGASKYLHYGAPLILVGIAGFFLRSFDRWMLADSLGASDVAMYALAVKFALIATFLTQPYQMWFLPKRFTLLRNEITKKQLGQYAIWGCVLTVITAAAMSAGAPILIYVMTPQTYHASIEYIPFLCFCAAIHMCTIYVNIGCYAQRTTKWPLIIDSAAATLIVALYTIFIPTYGIYGALGASVFVMFVRMTITITVSLHYQKIDYKVPSLATFILCYALTCAVQTFWNLPIGGQLLLGGLNMGVLGMLSIGLRLVPLQKIVRARCAATS